MLLRSKNVKLHDKSKLYFKMTCCIDQLLHPLMRRGIECLKRNRKNSHQQPLPGSRGKTGQAKADVNIPLIQRPVF
jgi:hypothetical protein